MRTNTGLSATKRPTLYLTHSLAFFGIIVCSSFISIAHADLYRWKTLDGRVHFGDNMPSSQAVHGYDVIDPSTGEVIRHIHRARTPEEIAKEDAAKKAAARAAAKIKAEQKAQEQHDHMLLSLYSNIGDLERTQKHRLRKIDDKIQQTQNAITRTHDRSKKAQTASEQKTAFKDTLQLRQNLFDLQVLRHQTTQQFEDDKRRLEQLLEQNKSKQSEQ